MFSLRQFHVFVSTGTLESDLLSLSTRYKGSHRLPNARLPYSINFFL